MKRRKESEALFEHIR